jgi:DNA-binding NarL/FixJ family response regulator
VGVVAGGKDPLSRYGQISNDIEIERQPGNWIDAMVADKRATVADQVTAKMDVGAWFATLTKRMKEIAKDLAFGCSTSEVARKYGVTAGRISQLRRTLEESWLAFQPGGGA